MRFDAMYGKRKAPERCFALHQWQATQGTSSISQATASAFGGLLPKQVESVVITCRQSCNGRQTSACHKLKQAKGGTQSDPSEVEVIIRNKLYVGRTRQGMLRAARPLLLPAHLDQGYPGLTKPPLLMQLLRPEPVRRCSVYHCDDPSSTTCVRSSTHVRSSHAL